MTDNEIIKGNKLMKKIAVYGSLRKGFGNNRLIADSEQLTTEVVKIPYKMVSLGGFPGLVPVKEPQDITIEVWNVDDQTYRNVERLEGYPHFYQKDTIQTSEGDADVYVLLSGEFANYAAIEGGDWKEYRKNLVKSY